jgi:hypothetical protein
MSTEPPEFEQEESELQPIATNDLLKIRSLRYYGW